MKTIKLLVFLILLAAAASAQQKKDNTIIILAGKNPSETFNQWVRVLITNQYRIQSKDSLFKTIETKPRTTSKYNYEYFLITHITDSSKIITTIQWRLKTNALTGSANFSPWQYTPAKGNIQNVIFKDIQILLNNYQEIIYKKN